MIPAVPAYLGKDFDTAPPGHRFSLYFPVWDPKSWEIEKTKKAAALKKTLSLSRESHDQIDALHGRQQSLLLPLDENSRFMLEAIATAPLITGMGMEHPLENGFAFLNPYGIPYLPGSSIKGVLRRAAEELAEDGHTDWSKVAVDQLFGHEVINNARQGALTFWDSIPKIKGNSLAMDVMTPHYGKYYQGDESPHDAEQPNPIVFMVIPAMSRFSFHVTTDLRWMKNVSDWKGLMQAAFEHAFDWLGFGTKTAVGYGAMEQLSDEEIEKAQRETEVASLKCDWVDETIQSLAKQNNIPENRLGDVLRGKALAEAWATLSDTDLKKRALDDIRSRWHKEGWWDALPGRAAKQAKSIYDETG